MSLLTAVLLEADKASWEELRKRCDGLVPRVTEVTEKIQLLSFDLQQNFTDLYLNFCTTKSLEQLNYKNRKRDIISDYSACLQETENLVKNYGVKHEELKKSCEKMNTSFLRFKDLCTVVEGKTVLEKANHAFERYNYTDALMNILDLQRMMKDLKFEGKLEEALSNLKYQSENQVSVYMAQLSMEWDEIFKWEEKKGVYFLTYSLSVQQSDPALIQKVLKTLYSTQRLNAELGLFSHFFLDKLLHNVIRHNCEIFTEDHIGALVFNIKVDLNDTKMPNHQTIFNNLTAIFEFLQSTLGAHFECDRKFIEVFGDSIREKFFNKVIEDCIKNNLPTCDSGYENYQSIVSELDCFNKFLIDLKFVDADKSSLNKYINDVESVLYDKKCDKLLSDVRELLSESLLHGTIEVGASPNVENESILDVSDKDILWGLSKPLFLPKCVISQNVKKIMAKIVEHLEESVNMPDKYSKQLVLYIKDIAVMYQSIVPLKFKVNLENCPLDIAIFFNNCFYLAHGLLGPPWRNVLPPATADQLLNVTIDCIQDLRVLGLEKMSLYIQKQKNIIVNAVENRDAPEQQPWTQESYDQFDSAINDVMNLMKDLKESWQAVLPARMYEKSISMLIQTLGQSVLLRMFADSRPISEELVHMIALRLEDTIKDIGTFFEEPIQIGTDIDVWNKFTKLPQLLKAQLLELAELWKENKDLSQSYSCEEVRQVIKMRFPDDKYRLKILKEIQ